MVPIADLTNHDGAMPNASWAWVRGGRGQGQSGGVFQMRTVAPVVAGCELTFSYGSNVPQHRLLLQYGFLAGTKPR